MIFLIPPPVESLEIFPASLNLQFVSGEKNKSVSLTVKNTGNVAVVPSFSWDSNLSNSKISVNRCASSLSPGKSCSLVITIPSPSSVINQTFQVFKGLDLKDSFLLSLKPPLISSKLVLLRNTGNYTELFQVDSKSGTKTTIIYNTFNRYSPNNPVVRHQNKLFFNQYSSIFDKSVLSYQNLDTGIITNLNIINNQGVALTQSPQYLKVYQNKLFYLINYDGIIRFASLDLSLPYNDVNSYNASPIDIPLKNNTLSSPFGQNGFTLVYEKFNFNPFGHQGNKFNYEFTSDGRLVAMVESNIFKVDQSTGVIDNSNSDEVSQTRCNLITLSTIDLSISSIGIYNVSTRGTSPTSGAGIPCSNPYSFTTLNGLLSEDKILYTSIFYKTYFSGIESIDTTSPEEYSLRSRSSIGASNSVFFSYLFGIVNEFTEDPVDFTNGNYSTNYGFPLYKTRTIEDDLSRGVVFQGVYYIPWRWWIVKLTPDIGNNSFFSEALPKGYIKLPSHLGLGSDYFCLIQNALDYGISQNSGRCNIQFVKLFVNNNTLFGFTKDEKLFKINTNFNDNWDEFSEPFPQYLELVYDFGVQGIHPSIKGLNFNNSILYGNIVDKLIIKDNKLYFTAVIRQSGGEQWSRWRSCSFTKKCSL